MSGRPLSVNDKIAAWYAAFEAVREQLTPKEMRAVLALVTSDRSAADLSATVRLASQVMANDRSAALVAALMVGSGGVRLVPMENDEPS